LNRWFSGAPIEIDAVGQFSSSNEPCTLSRGSNNNSYTKRRSIDFALVEAHRLRAATVVSPFGKPTKAELNPGSRGCLLAL
jgi:hypothetical protein